MRDDTEHGIIVTIHPPRRDGRHPTTYQFKSTGTTHRKLLTAEQVAEVRRAAAGAPSLYLIKG